MFQQSLVDLWKFLSIENDNILNKTSVDTITTLEIIIITLSPILKVVFTMVKIN